MNQNDEIIIRLTRIEEKLNALGTTLAHHDEILYGNGKPGLLIEHDRLMTSYKWGKWVIGSTLSAIFIALAELFMGSKR